MPNNSIESVSFSVLLC